MDRDQVFLRVINSVYDYFRLHQVEGDISIYTYGEYKEKIETPVPGQGDIAFIINENGNLIVVDYALIIKAMKNKEIRLSDDEHEKYKTIEEKIGRFASVHCFSIFAFRENRLDFNKKETKFKIDISDCFISNYNTVI
jgi:hypothetical protein